MSKQEQAFNQALESLTALDNLKEQVAVLGNLFIQVGLSHIQSPPVDLSWKNLPEIVIQDIKKNGETLANALVRQGLILCTWIEERGDRNGIKWNPINL